jgi:pyridoxamine 5'-phosphate oxidase
MKEISEQVEQLRTEYAKGELDAANVASDPIIQFGKWMDEALQAEVIEANAMSLGTCAADGQPSVRIVLLRGFDEAGFMFFTNYDSAKGRSLTANPKAALTFFWAELERQIRIEGIVEKATKAESDDYFMGRPRESRLGAWASPQSQVIADRDELESFWKGKKSEFDGTEVIRPANWGGFRLRPQTIEFWQGRPSRLHDRIRYRAVEDDWVIERLAP